jgi:SH3-like domain-containing protein
MLNGSMLAAVVLAAVASAAGAAERACDVDINVMDQDPKGMNVRATPNGAVTGALRARGQWIQLHVVAQDGEWMRFDNAVLYDDKFADGEGPIKPDHGWAHVSKLGVESFAANAEIRLAPDQASRVLANAGANPDAQPRPVVLACTGEWLQVRWKGVTGWTRDACANQNTTCS